MPPEPLPWDRKDFVFKARKHDRITSGEAIASSTFGGGGGNSTPRRRDPYHFPRASPRRPPPSYHRQNGSYYQLYDDSNGHGCMPSRSDDGFRSSNGRYNGGRSSGREIRGSFRRSPYWDGYEPSYMTSQRSVAVPITSPPPPPPPPPPLKDDKNSGGDDQKSDRDRGRGQDNSLGSIGWKPLKWNRQGSISSSKAVRSEVEEAGSGSLEILVPNLGKETPVRSPVSSPVPLDDGLPKKKPRLTWGQGLAKYEKQKVEGSSNSGKDQASESSPKVVGMGGSMSPATPCSVACPSPGTEERPFSKLTNDNDTSHLSQTSALALQNCSEELTIKLDQLPPICTLSSLLNDLLQPEDACTGDSTSTRYTCTNKLLLFKADISKELEKTECEIDLLENELRSLNNNGRSDPGQILLADSSGILCLESAGVSSKVSSNSTSVISSVVTTVGELLMPIHSSGDEVKLAHNDISQTASSNNGESTPSGDEEPLALDLEERAVTENGSRNFNQLDPSSSDANVNLDMISHEKRNSNLIDLIMASNREAAKRASHVFEGALSIAQQQSDIWGSDKFLSWRKNDKQIREKLAVQKNQLKFKERVLTLKFRAFHHLWKEDLRLLSVRKQRSKSQKRFELCSRSSQSSSQKNRSSIRSRFTLPAGNLTLVPTADIVDFTSRLLSDSQVKLYRKNLKMPALVLDEERRYSRFITNNNLIEDPSTFERERSLINSWTHEEKVVFMEILATYGKDFGKISSFLSHKTTADCVEFYYKNHKSESFTDVKKQLDLRKQWRLSTNTYLVTSGKKGNREANAASLDMLGAVSVAVAHKNGNARNHQNYAGKSVVPSYHGSKVSRGSYSSLERVSSVEISGYEKDTVGTDVLTSGYGALASEAVRSCVTSSVLHPEKMNYVRAPEGTQTIEKEDTCSDEGCGELDLVDWTDEEKIMIIRALSLYGKDFARISDCVGTKSRDQCKIFFSKARKCLSLDQIRPGPGNGSTPMSDANGGRSDTDDACAAEMDSAICSTQSCSRMDVDFTQSVTNICVEGFIHVGNTSLQTETNRSSEQYELGGSNQEEVDGKVGGLESDLNVEKLETERENLRSKRVEGMGDAVLKHTELVPSCDVAKLLVDRDLGRVENGISAYAVEPSTLSCTEDGKLKIQTCAYVPQGVIPVGRAAAVGLKSEVELQQFPVVSESRSGERQKKIDTDKSNSANFSYAAVSSAKEIDSYISRKVTACPTRSLNFSTHEFPMPLELLSCSQKKSQMLSSKQDRAYSAPLSTMLPDPSSISSESSFQVPSESESMFNFNEHLHKLHQESATKDLYQQCLSRINLNQINLSCHVPSGYPVQALNQKESKALNQKESNREANIISEKPILRESHSMGNLNSQLNRNFVPDIHNENAENLVASNSSPGVLFSQRNKGTSDAQLRPCSTNTCQEADEQSTQRTGDVKLFGQILTNPSSRQKSNSSSQETDCQPRSPKQRQLVTMKMSPGRKDSISSIFPSRCENIDQSSLEEVPLRSYGYWDGSRIQTGFSSLSDPAVMLAAYQGTVAGTQVCSSKNNGVSSANGVATNYQQAYTQPLPANGKCLDSFSDLQRRNRFELVSDFQQGGGTAMARLSGNMARGSRGIMVGGTGVSDPVAALKMAKLYTGEVESWMRDLN